MSHRHSKCDSSCERTHCRKEKVKYCCKKCNHEGKLKVKVETVELPTPVQATASLVSAVPLTDAVAVTLLFNSVVINTAIPGCSRYTPGTNVYDPVTGTFTVPRCGKGLYNITTHVTAIATSELSTTDTVMVQIRVNNIAIATSWIALTSTLQTNDTDLTINYPLQPGQTVTVVVTPTISSGTVSIVNPSTFLSIAKIAELVC